MNGRSATTRDGTRMPEGLPRFSKAPRLALDHRSEPTPIRLYSQALSGLAYLRTMTTLAAERPARLKGESGLAFATLGALAFHAGSRGDSE